MIWASIYSDLGRTDWARTLTTYSLKFILPKSLNDIIVPLRKGAILNFKKSVFSIWNAWGAILKMNLANFGLLNPCDSVLKLKLCWRSFKWRQSPNCAPLKIATLLVRRERVRNLVHIILGSSSRLLSNRGSKPPDLHEAQLANGNLVNSGPSYPQNIKHL